MFRKALDVARVLAELIEDCDDDSIRDPAEISISFIEQAVKPE